MRRYSRSWIRFLNDVPSITAGRCTGPVRSIILVFVCRRRLWMWVRKDLMGWLLIEGRHLLKVTWSDPRHVDAFPSFETLDSQNQWNRFLRAPVELRIITDNPITDPIHPEKMSREPLSGGIPPFSGPLSEPLSSLSPLSAIRSRRKKYPSLRYLFQICGTGACPGPSAFGAFCEACIVSAVARAGGDRGVIGVAGVTCPTCPPCIGVVSLVAAFSG